MRKAIFISLVAVIIGAGASYSVYSLSSTSKANLAITGSSVASAATNRQPDNSYRPGTAILVFDKYGFMPNQFSVPVGTKVLVENKSASPLLFQALANQPNQLNSLNLGTIDAGSSSSLVVSKLGSWQFQANNNPALRGDITASRPGKSPLGLIEKELPQYNPATHSLLINYTDYGFVPNIVSVPAGTKITVMNSTNEGGMDLIEMNGDTAPAPVLNQGIIEKGQTASFTLSRPGTYHYLNGWETTDMGRITVN